MENINSDILSMIQSNLSDSKNSILSRTCKSLNKKCDENGWLRYISLGLDTSPTFNNYVKLSLVHDKTIQSLHIHNQAEPHLWIFLSKPPETIIYTHQH